MTEESPYVWNMAAATTPSSIGRSQKGDPSTSLVHNPQVKLISLKDEFEAYSRDTKEILQLEDKTISEYKAMTESLSVLLEKTLNVYDVNLLTKEDQCKIHGVRQKPNLIVIGQTNSGKSSLINELLRGSVLAMRQIPCTARLVKVKYGKPQRVMVKTPDGRNLEVKELKKKTIPRELVELTDEQRRNPKMIGSYVVAELDNEFLASGIEIVDSPGLQENEKLDELVQNELTNSIPFVVYVLDGKNQFTEQDRSDIRKVQMKTDAIFFVVTKVDRDQDDMRDEETVVAEKKTRAYDSLVREGFLPFGVPMEQCDRFHGISNWKVKEYRRRKLSGPDPFLQDFQRFQQCLCDFVSLSLNAAILTSSRILIASHRGCLHFFIEAATVARLQQEAVLKGEKILSQCGEIQQKVFSDAMKKLSDQKQETQQAIASDIKKKKKSLIAKVKHHKLKDIPADQQAKKGDVLQNCTQQIVDLVVDNLAVNTSATIRSLFQQLDKQLKKIAKELEELGEESGEPNVSAILKNCYMGSYEAESKNFLQDKQISWLGKFKKLLKTLLKSPRRLFSSTVKVDENWKEDIATETFDRVDAAEIADHVIRQAKEHLEKCNTAFGKARGNIDRLQKVAVQCTEDDAIILRKWAPKIAELELSAYTITDRREFGIPEPRTKIGEGGQGNVYECGKFGKEKAEYVVKSISVQNAEYIKTNIAMEVHYARSIEHKRILPLIASIKTDDHVYLISPRMKWDLKTALPRIEPLRDRLIIAREISEGIEYLHSRGIVHRDIKASNILLDDSNHVKIADLGLCKTGSVTDKLMVETPLHMSPEIFLEMPYDKHVDVYAFGVLLWSIHDGTGKLPENISRLLICPPLLLLHGIRPEKMSYFDERLWRLMENCWRSDTSEGLSFENITKKLQSIIGS
ncbi:dual serine/threonine and tyrosine protein kinase-like [Ptychodera flava]|uniref:dual serine/threonine and tyrosine protein kinase-like n=1 Tax=Ptychodera flava TaxID=63121 RepID=UPI00396A8A57